jgi:hypothetical protein
MPTEPDQPRRRRAKRPPAVLCTAKKRNGEPCGNPPIPGGTVCRYHGGAAKHVRAAADARLQNATYGLVGVLVNLAQDPDVAAGDRIRAASTALGFAGYKAGATVEVTVERSWDHVLDSVLVDVDEDIEDAELVDEPGPVAIETARRADEEAQRKARAAAKHQAQRRIQQARIQGSDAPPSYAQETGR